MEDVFIHHSAIVDEGAIIGKGSSIWHFAHIRSSAVLGENVIIGKSSYIDANVKLGNNVKIQNLVSVYNGVTIGDDVFVGPHVTFTNDMFPRIGYGWKIVETKVDDNVSIGANATIVCGSILSEYCFIGAGAVLPANRLVPPHALVIGNPGRIKGWVCKCGHKLLGDESAGLYKLVCSNCDIPIEIDVKPIQKIS